MFLVGAEFNYYEHTQKDWVMSHKLFIDELISNHKLSKFFKKHKSSGSSIIFEYEENLCNTNKKNSMTMQNTFNNNLTKYKRTTTNTSDNSNIFNNDSISLSNNANGRESSNMLNKEKFMISNNLSSDLFIKVILSDESILKLGEINTYFFKSSSVLENIKEKMKVDSIVRPLKIFWIKADYNMVSRIIALLGTGLAMMLSTVLKSVDFSKYLTG